MASCACSIALCAQGCSGAIARTLNPKLVTDLINLAPMVRLDTLQCLKLTALHIDLHCYHLVDPVV